MTLHPEGTPKSPKAPIVEMLADFVKKSEALAAETTLLSFSALSLPRGRLRQHVKSLTHSSLGT